MEPPAQIDYNACNDGVVCVIGQMDSYVFKLYEPAGGIYRPEFKAGMGSYGDITSWSLLNDTPVDMVMVGIVPDHVRVAAMTLVEKSDGKAAPLFTTSAQLELIAARICADWYCLERWPIAEVE